MNYVFFGGQESEFAEIFLSKMKEAGLAPMVEIRNAKKDIDLAYLKSLGADFFLVASFGKILKPDLISIPEKGVVGVHPSLLPKYRGASPIQSVLLNDEKETGTTLFLIDEKVDHGPIIAQKKLAIEHKDTYETLVKKLAELSADLAIEALPVWAAGKTKPEIQSEVLATFTKKFSTEDALVDLEEGDAVKNWLKIKALNPEPGAFTNWELKNGKSLRLKLLEADFQNGDLKIKRVQPEGKKPMDYEAFLNGYKK